MIEKKYAIGYDGGTKKQFIESNFNLILIRKYVTCINKN
jgi:hypothetical protein